MKEMKGIVCCGDCGYYNWNKHNCSRGCKDEGLATDQFYKDCPLPKVQLINQWIPCSERLPENIKTVLVTLKEVKEPTIGWYGNIDGWRLSEKTFSEIEHEVIAWMPLPEPYKVGELDG